MTWGDTVRLAAQDEATLMDAVPWKVGDDTRFYGETHALDVIGMLGANFCANLRLNGIDLPEALKPFVVEVEFPKREFA